tara:strand:+ start:1504 stop:2604 length:1101 start_codon:yes stop_codon:yes gene_type:complete
MNLLNRYIIKKILSKYLFLLVGFLILFLIVDIIENIDKFSDSEISTTKIFYYYIYSIPWFISIALPMTTLLSCIFTIGQLQKHHELTALKASGISLKKLSIIFILLGIIISASSFLFDNTLVSSSTKKRTEITKKYLSNKSKSQQIKKFHLVNNSSGLKNILYISNYDFINRHAKNVTITELDKNNNLIATYTVDTLAWNDRQSSWNCKNVKKRKANNNFQAEFISEQEIELFIHNQNNDNNNFKEEDLIKFLPDSDELNYWELKKLSERRPQDLRLKVDYNFKIAFSCTSLIMILFGIGLSITKPRTNSATGIGVGIMVIFLYYIGMKFGQSLGYSKILSPFLSVWMINIIFIGVGAWLYSKIRT